MKRKSESSDVDKKSHAIREYPFFKAVKPNRRYLFHSDYFRIDDKYGSILTIFHHDGADGSLSYFWGINLIPRDLKRSVVVRFQQHIGRMSDGWIDGQQGKAEGLADTSANETSKDGSFKSKAKASRKRDDLGVIAQDLLSGASYLRVAFRLVVKADSLNDLDDAIAKINRQYKDRFETVYAAAYSGEQRREMGNLYRGVDKKEGRNFMFTSTEFAGNYNLVTHGIEDPNGEYVGQMIGDVNNSAVILDVNRFSQNVVLAGKNKGKTLSRLDLKGQRGVDVWATKLGFNTLMNGGKVVHLVLNGAKIEKIGVDLSDITSVVSMDRGDINMFEIFGSVDDEMQLFSAQLEKLTLMAKQSYKEGKSEILSIIDGSVKDIATKFYIDERMWQQDAQNNRNLLRIVGIPHEDVPQLLKFVTYLEMEYTSMVKSTAYDPDMMRALNTLRLIFKNMLEANGDLFNTVTSDIVDKATVARRVIYDFSSLRARGENVAMAQFINALGFAVGSLGEGDVVMLHGADLLDKDVRDYVKLQFDNLYDKNVRTVFVYSSIDKMIKDISFNEFDKADYTILGGMSESSVQDYEKALRQSVPIALKKLLVTQDPTRYYLRRGFDNITFGMDLQMGIQELEPSGGR